MALDQEIIDQQLDLLAAHRRTLFHLLREAAQFSAGHLPAHVANGIADARGEITRIKTYLRENNVQVDDEPNDDVSPDPEQRRKLRVFLCHSSKDKSTVRQLYHRLLRDGFVPWLDEEDLLAGQAWELEIPKAVRSSDIVLVCLSRSSINRSGYVQKEIEFALDVAEKQPKGTIFIIPLRLEECRVPERLRRWHWVDFYDARGYERLLRALTKRVDEIGDNLVPGPEMAPPNTASSALAREAVSAPEMAPSNTASSASAVDEVQRPKLPSPSLPDETDKTATPTLSQAGGVARPRLQWRPWRGTPPVAIITVVVALIVIVSWIAGTGSFAKLMSRTSLPTPPAPPLTIDNVTATLAGPRRIVVEADTNLPSGSTVTASMKEGDQDVAWYNKDTASAQVSNGHVTVVLEKANNAPTPKRNQPQTITLVATAAGQVVSSEPAMLAVPSIYSAQFYGTIAAAPTAAPTAAAVHPTTLPVPTIASPVELKATVFNGGNIRKQPRVTSNRADVIGQLHTGEVVAVLKKTADSAWYYVKASEAEGWVSVTLLTIDPGVSEEVPAGS